MADRNKSDVYIEQLYSFKARVLDYETGKEEEVEYEFYLNEDGDLKASMDNVIDRAECEVLSVYDLKFDGYMVFLR